MSALLPEYRPVPDDLHLAHLQVVHRHGERTPVRGRLEKIIPATWNLCDANRAMFATILDFNAERGQSNDGIPARFMPLQRLVERPNPNKDLVTYPAGACYYGQLTNLGRQSMTALGARLREIYIDRMQFLPDKFDASTVHIRSSDYPRTQESVQQMVAGGLYPAEKRDAGATLAIRTRDPRIENLYANPSCPRLRQLAKAFHKTVNDMYQDKFKAIAHHLKEYVDDVSLTSHPSANGILDTVVSAKVHGFELPAAFDDDVIYDLERIVADEWFYGHQQSAEVRRLGIGRLVGEIGDRMAKRADGTDQANGEDKLKLAVYSGHDTTIAPLLIVLGAFDKRWPPFGSSIIFELYKGNQNKGGWFGKKQSDHYVRVRFNDKVVALPGCAENGKHHDSGDATLCTLEAFMDIVRTAVPDDWDKECQQIE
ncbi:phosphoglycerate mutase-like protein [Gongronella butleri]|nr:phosphoglycerate mutase-like protein [Gongronella butleri]